MRPMKCQMCNNDISDELLQTKNVIEYDQHTTNLLDKISLYNLPNNTIIIKKETDTEVVWNIQIPKKQSVFFYECSKCNHKHYTNE